MANLNIFKAVRNNDLDRVRFLIESCVTTNTDILKKDNWGQTALHLASHLGHLEIVKFLIESYVATNADILEKDHYGQTALHIASSWGHTEIVKFLIESYVATNANTNVSEKDNDGWTALHNAALYGYFDIVKLLVESGLDIEIRNKNGHTTIDLAKTEEIKKFLMEQLEIQQNRYVLK